MSQSDKALRLLLRTCPLYALIGKLILRVAISDDQREIGFNTETGWIRYEALADCCSESWFADIIGIDALIGNIVTFTRPLAMIEMEQNARLQQVMDPCDGRTRQEVDEVYAYAIETPMGVTTLAFRNSSNGYYGGELSEAEFSPDIFEPARYITEDWSA